MVNKVSYNRRQTGSRKVILSGYRGSIAHNLHIPAAQDKTFGIDDTDFFELYCFPTEYYLSLDGYYHNSEVFEEIKDDADTVGYEIRKAFHLLSQCNPNVLLFLYNRPEHYRHISAGGKLLLKNREIFLSRERIKKAFIGYASDQWFHGAASPHQKSHDRHPADDPKFSATPTATSCWRLKKAAAQSNKSVKLPPILKPKSKPSIKPRRSPTKTIKPKLTGC